MAVISDQSNFEKMPTGNFVARCIGVFHIGTHSPINFRTQPPENKRQIVLMWETPTELRKDGKPFTPVKWYTESLSEKSNLSGDLENWFAKKFSAEQRRTGFDTAKLLGHACVLCMVESDKNADRINVGSVTGVMKGLEVPQPVNETLYYCVDEHTDEAFAALPEWLQKKVADSAEYKAMFKPIAQAAAAGVLIDTGKPSLSIDADDIPF